MARWNFWKGRILVASVERPINGKNRKLAQDWVSKKPATRHVAIHTGSEVIELWHPWAMPKRKGN
jgi:hypothetical protein